MLLVIFDLAIGVFMRNSDRMTISAFFYFSFVVQQILDSVYERCFNEFTIRLFVFCYHQLL